MTFVRIIFGILTRIFFQLNQAPRRAVNSHSGNFFIRSPIADWVRPATHNNILGLCWLPCSQIGERQRRGVLFFMRKQATYSGSGYVAPHIELVYLSFAVRPRRLVFHLDLCYAGGPASFESHMPPQVQS